MMRPALSVENDFVFPEGRTRTGMPVGELKNGSGVWIVSLSYGDKSTSTSSASLLDFNLFRTGAAYTADAKESVIRESRNLINAVVSILPPTNEELDRFVDGLISQSYKNRKARSLRKS